MKINFLKLLAICFLASIIPISMSSCNKQDISKKLSQLSLALSDSSRGFFASQVADSVVNKLGYQPSVTQMTQPGDVKIENEIGDQVITNFQGNSWWHAYSQMRKVPLRSEFSVYVEANKIALQKNTINAIPLGKKFLRLKEQTSFWLEVTITPVRVNKKEKYKIVNFVSTASNLNNVMSDGSDIIDSNKIKTFEIKTQKNMRGFESVGCNYKPNVGGYKDTNLIICIGVEKNGIFLYEEYPVVFVSDNS